MKTNINLSLYIKFKNPGPHIKYNVTPTPVDIIDSVDETIYKFDVDAKNIFNFSIDVPEIPIGSAVIIDKIILNDILLNYVDSFGVYKIKQGIKKTNGYIDEPGTYNFKIRYNALIQNYLTFLINP